jgi:multicomponent Na+:H+ antiporter subunit D
MSGGAALGFSVLAPLAAALLALVAGRRIALASVLGTLSTLAPSCMALVEVARSGPLRHAAGGFGGPLGIDLRADGLAALMLAALALVGAAVSAYALDHFRGDAAGARAFFAPWFFTWSALHALVLSADVFNMYVALELTTLSAVSLVATGAARPALASALRYLLLALVGSLSYLLGVAVLYGAASVLDARLLGAALVPSAANYAACGLITVGLCLKAALFPFHAWLPPAYANAPAPVSVLLSALVTKGSFYVLLRLWLEVFPALVPGGGAQLLGALGGAAVLWGSLLALRQRRLKLLLAYSSIAQIGYLFLVFPLGGARAQAGALLLVVSHAAAKGAMFVAAGTIERTVGHDRLAAFRGLAGRLPVTFAALALAGVSLMGMPPSGGFIAKWLLVSAAIERKQWWWAGVLLGGGLLASLYVFRLLRPAFAFADDERKRRAPRNAEYVALFLALLAFGLGVAPDLPLAVLRAGGLP